MTTTAVIVTRPTPHVAQVAINRPEAKNAIDETTRLALIEAIEAALADDTVRALLLCGTSGVFCAGGDLASMRGMSEEQARTRMRSGHKLVQLLWNADIPVVVAMEKFAIGAGAGLALVADYIIAGETARMNFPFLNLGLVPDWGSTQSLVRKAGWGTARRLVLDRASLKGEQLLELKLVEQIVEDDKVMEIAVDKAREFSLLPRLALRQFKETMRQSPLAMESALRAEENHQTNCFLSEEFEEGLTALQEKRPPDFLNLTNQHQPGGPTMQHISLQILSDKALISDQLYRYAKGLDTRDWDLVASVFTDPFHLEAEMLDIDCTLSPREYIELAPGKFLPGFDATTHLNTNQLITVEGELAHIETRMYACHYINPTGTIQTGQLSAPQASTHCNMQMPWEGWLTRQPDGCWLFHKVHMGVATSEGDLGAMTTALSRNAS